MTLSLSFHGSHRSIRNFETRSLPGFTLVTGVNGSGKTHFLEGIKGGKIVAPSIQNMDHIRYFNWESFAPSLSESVNPISVRDKKDSAISSIMMIIDGNRKQMAKRCDEVMKHLAKDCSFDSLMNMSEQQLRDGILEAVRQANGNDVSDIDAVLQKFFAQKKEREQSIFVQIKQYHELYKKLLTLSEGGAKNILTITKSDIEEFMPVFWSDRQILELKLADWFAAWHAEYEYNRLNRYYFEAHGETDRPWITDVQFRERYGPEPWDICNRVMEDAGVRHRFTRPLQKIETLHKTFTLELHDPDTGDVISAKDLSSGEKVILAVASLLFQTKESAVITELPKLLLLDEVDAPLHPTFVKTMMNFLEEEIVAKCGVSVIMTTHSPSTVALAPEGSVFELVRGPTHKLRPITPSLATQRLSEGFITLSRNDVMVITESGADVEYYEKVYEALLRAGKVNPHPKLTFIPASRSRKDNGGGGCTQVRHWAPKLSELGIARFRGLVDWDARAEADTVVSVLKRYSWENYLFDPLTLLGFLLSKGINVPSVDGFVYPKSSVELIASPQERVQACIDAFVKWLGSKLGDGFFDAASRVEVDYEQWAKLSLPRWFVDTNGHELEAALRAVLNPLSTAPILKKDQFSDLIHYQANEASGLISADFAGIFQKLQSSEESEG